MTIRRLILCFDGTWNTPDSAGEPTNVVKLIRAIGCREGDDSQIVFYDKGVGTGNLTDRIIGGASGKGLTENVIDGYRFLGNNYADGDEIYILGFSRGAYTARSLAGLVALTGIIGPRHLGARLREVVDICRDHALDGAAKRRAIAGLDLDRRLDVPIKCVGVWDTVGSLGIPGDLGRQLYLKPYHFGDVQLSPLVDVALHAVAIDEKRSAFAPTLWVSHDGAPARPDQIVEQVWFPGVHSNVGGSYPDTGLSDMALLWMARRLRRHTDLVIDQDYLSQTCRPSAEGIGYESRSAVYQTSRLFPYQRLINQTIPRGSRFGDWFRDTFTAADRRNLVPDNMKTINEALHVCALDRWRAAGVLHDVRDEKGARGAYRPDNLRAVIEHRRVPVVDAEGELMPEAAVDWPSLDTPVATPRPAPAG